MTDIVERLAACPCGKTPTDVSVYDAGQGGKWANVAANCCGEWMIEFRTNYTALDSDECKRLAVKAWNSAPFVEAMTRTNDSPTAIEPLHYADYSTENRAQRQLKRRAAFCPSAGMTC